ncbi:hypothetical protein NIES4074_04020 [Cylindrospermum sp. NIES-4074]|nr:hypothetical protein NIES4074_04020 [Cylindrospermum sp. NIES-4074]
MNTIFQTGMMTSMIYVTRLYILEMLLIKKLKNIENSISSAIK